MNAVGKLGVLSLKFSKCLLPGFMLLFVLTHKVCQTIVDTSEDSRAGRDLRRTRVRFSRRVRKNMKICSDLVANGLKFREGHGCCTADVLF